MSSILFCTPCFGVQVFAPHMKSCLEGARKALVEQQSQNEAAPAGAFRQGERLFEEWKQGDAARHWAIEAAHRVALGGDLTGLEL